MTAHSGAHDAEPAELGTHHVVSQHLSDHFEKRRLAGRPSTVEKEKRVFARVTSERISNRTLQESDQFIIPIHDAIKKREPLGHTAFASYLTGANFLITSPRHCPRTSPTTRFFTPP